MSDHEAKQATPHATLLAELLDSRIPKSEREHAAAREVERLTAALRHEADCVEAYRAQVETMIRERDELRDVLLRRGFVPCNVPACNCGSWHHRYGLPERMQEIKDALAEAGHELSNANGNLTLNALKALVAERDDLRRQLAEARAEREAMANVLPGVYYMDPPDGGDVSLLKQLQRMSNDAARYRLLRRKFAIISDGEGNAEFCPINLPRPTYIAPNTAIELDTALDRERLGLDGAKRPPTPVGWSDTDWIKHLQEQAEQPHPLAGQHINQGSMDAAADAYEAEYYDALKRDARRYRWLRGREDGRYMTVYAFRTDIDEVCLGDELDAAIDAAMGLTRPAEES